MTVTTGADLNKQSGENHFIKVFHILGYFISEKSIFIEVTKHRKNIKHIKEMKGDKCEVKLVEVQVSSCSSTAHLIFFHH